MKITFTFFLFVFFTGISSAQQIKRSAISSFATTYQSNGEGVMIASTAGQSSNTMLFSSGDTRLRQGFQQPPAFRYKEKVELDVQFGLFPNPANQQFTMVVDGEELTYRFSVFDAAGRLILTEKIASRTPVRISSNGFSPGTYLLTISNYNNQRLATERLVIQH